MRLQHIGWQSRWDLRSGDAARAPLHIVEGHREEVNCVAFNPANEYMLATGSSDATVALWDMRKMTTAGGAAAKPLHILEGHTGDVLQLQWSPHHEGVLASAAADRRINVWDLTRIGTEQDPEDAEDGPPELLVRMLLYCALATWAAPCIHALIRR